MMLASSLFHSTASAAAREPETFTITTPARFHTDGGHGEFQISGIPGTSRWTYLDLPSPPHFFRIIWSGSPALDPTNASHYRLLRTTSGQTVVLAHPFDLQYRVNELRIQPAK